jgi:hypothetical protein
MRFQLRSHGWPLEGGRSFIPEGTTIDTDNPTDPWSALVVALGITMPPPNAQPLDQATYQIMVQGGYPSSAIITVPGADGINRP